MVVGFYGAFGWIYFGLYGIHSSDLHESLGTRVSGGIPDWCEDLLDFGTIPALADLTILEIA